MALNSSKHPLSPCGPAAVVGPSFAYCVKSGEGSLRTRCLTTPYKLSIPASCGAIFFANCSDIISAIIISSNTLLAFVVGGRPKSLRCSKTCSHTCLSKGAQAGFVLRSPVQLGKTLALQIVGSPCLQTRGALHLVGDGGKGDFYRHADQAWVVK